MIVALLAASPGFCAPGVSVHPGHRAAPPVAFFGSRRWSTWLADKPAGDLATVDHEEAVEVTLSGGQRRTLRDKGKGLPSFKVADVSQAISEVAGMLAEEQLLKLKFVSCEKKPEAQLQANELAARTGAAVAECKGNECLLYRPPSAGQMPKFAV